MKKICTDVRLENSSLFSAEAVVNNEDLIREIFLRLPVRSLIRFQLVSKYWSSLINDPQFARERTQQLNPNSTVPSGLFFYNSLTKRQKIDSVSLDDSSIQHSRVRVPSLSFLNTVSGGAIVKILQSCNGLLLCKFESKSGNEYCVCNPTTKKYKILPQFYLKAIEKACAFTLAFDPSVSPRYKVVCLKRLLYSSNSQIEIYSSETGKWSTSTCGSYRWDCNSFKSSGFYWNSSIHWIKNDSSQYNSYEWDIENDIFKGVDMPKCPQDYWDQTLRYFGESKGRLHLIYIRSRSAKKFQVLERDSETLNWSVKYRVHICHLLSKFPEICVKAADDYVFSKVEYAFSILSVYKGEKEEDSALILTIPGKVVSYNLHSKTSRVLSGKALPSREVIYTTKKHYHNAFNFIETLAEI